MTQPERNRSILTKYVPVGTEDTLVKWIYHFDFKLKIKKSRASKYGDYRPPLQNTNHHISINNDLNQYAFLITLVHEIAHLGCWQKHQNAVKPHGEEWKKEFKMLMQPFMNEEVFPADVLVALRKYLHDPAASSCSDLGLLRALKKYDQKQDVIYLEQLPHGSIFKYNKRDELFRKGNKVRTRFLCKAINTNRDYLFNPLTEVKIPENQG
jgi:SprT protein